MKHFKSRLVLVCVAVFLVIAIAVAAPYYYTLIIRTALIDYGTLSVTGTSTLTGAVTCGSTISATNFTTVTDSAMLKVIAAGYHHSDASPNVLAITNYAGTIKAKIDSAGLATVVGLTTTGPITATSQTLAIGAITGTTFSGTTISGTIATLDSANSKVGLFGRRHADATVYPLIVANYAGTTKASIDTAGNAVVVALTATGAITATGQTIASGAITVSGTSSFVKAKIGAGGSGSGIATLDSAIVTGDSLLVYIGALKGAIYLH